MTTNKISSSSSSSSSQVDEDYIEMELSSSSSSSASSNFQCYSSTISSPPQSREFEFQMSSVFQDKETTNFPADELFYKGKLLPLHLPPRLQMVQKLLLNATTNAANDTKSSQPFEEKFGSIPSCTNSNNTPSESCNISPSESCRVSCEISPDEYFFEWSSEINSFIGNHPKNSWTKKLKKSSIGQKLKASSAYLKSLFSKSGCTNESSCAKAASDVEEASPSPIASKGKELCSNKYLKVTNNSVFAKSDNDRYKASKSSTLLKSIEKEMMAEDDYISQRRSFSGVIQWHSSSKSLSPSSISTSSSGSSSSSSFSFSSIGFCDLHFLKRSSSANSELENSIEGAIAHCKMSQQLISSTKNASEVLGGPNCSLSPSRITACED